MTMYLGITLAAALSEEPHIHTVTRSSTPTLSPGAPHPQSPRAPHPVTRSSTLTLSPRAPHPQSPGAPHPHCDQEPHTHTVTRSSTPTVTKSPTSTVTRSSTPTLSPRAPHPQSPGAPHPHCHKEPYTHSHQELHTHTVTRSPTQMAQGGWQDQRPVVRTEGETVFGLHPVTLALTSHLRSRLYTLFIDGKHRDSFHQSAGSFHPSAGSFHQSAGSFHPSADSFQPSASSFHRIKQLAVRRQVPIQFVPKKTLTHLSGNRPHQVRYVVYLSSGEMCRVPVIRLDVSCRDVSCTCHQGVCLDASPRLVPQCDIEQSLPGMDLSPGIVWVLLYSVQDPMNCGAILRSCYYLGVDRVIIPTVNSCALSGVVSKASAGAMETMDIQHIHGGHRSLRHLTQVWQSHGGKVVGTTSADDSCRPVHRLQDFTVTAPTLLIVGNEGRGIDQDVLELCDVLLTIPPPPSPHPHPSVTSLNVSVAAGILIHWLRTASPQ
ncbi:hypothetical protein ACOMHN_003479 [Nucella lapillus]